MISRKKIVVFLLLTLIISMIFYVEIASSETARNVGGFFMWSPGLAAIATQFIFKDSIKSFGWSFSSWRYLAAGLMIPLLYAFGIYLFVWCTGLGIFQPLPYIKLLIYLTVGLILACTTALGEEIGWRGFLLPELLNFTSPTTASWIIGGFWAVWHYPLIIFGDYRSTTPLWFQLITFTFSVLGLSFMTTWLRIKSQSIWPVVIWHGAHNLFIQQIFLEMTRETTLTDYFVDDFGIGLLISMIFIGGLSWRNLKKLS